MKKTRFCPKCYKMFETDGLIWYIPGPEKRDEIDEPDGEIICPKCAEKLGAMYYTQLIVTPIVR